MAKKKRTKSEAGTSTDSIDFETALGEVESVVEKLESGELGLSDSLQEYEKGIERIKQCHEMLERVERRISVLVSVDESGQAEVEPVQMGPSEEGGDDDNAAKSPRKAKRVRTNRPAPPNDDMDDSGGLF